MVGWRVLPSGMTRSGLSRMILGSSCQPLTERSEIGFLNLRQTYLIRFTEIGEAEEQAIRLLAFSTDRVGQVHTYDLNTSNGQGDCQTRIWDGEHLRLSEPKSFWSYLKDFSIHSLR